MCEQNRCTHKLNDYFAEQSSTKNKNEKKSGEPPLFFVLEKKGGGWTRHGVIIRGPCKNFDTVREHTCRGILISKHTIFQDFQEAPGLNHYA